MGPTATSSGENCIIVSDMEPSCIITIASLLSQLAEDWYAANEHFLYDGLGCCVIKFLKDCFDYVLRCMEKWLVTCYWSRPDLVCINPFGVINPMDVVSTTIHEFVNLKLIKFKHICGDDHCLASWESACMLTRAFAVSFLSIHRFILYHVYSVCGGPSRYCYNRIKTANQ